MNANEIERLLSTPEARDFYHATQNIWQKDKSFTSYIGFNVSRDAVLNCKLYASFFQRLTPDEVKVLYPNVGGFYQHYDAWQPSEIPLIYETGCSFAVKLDMDGNVADGFHYRIPLTDEILQLNAQDRDILSHAMNYGFSEEALRSTPHTMQKHYFYVGQAESKALLAERFKDPLMKQAGMIEYTKTNRHEKIIGWFEHQSALSNEYFSNINWPVINELIDWAKQYDCIPIAPGLYLDHDIRSIYFIKPQPTIETETQHVNNGLECFADFFKGTK